MKQVHVCSLKELQWLLRNNKVNIARSFAIISSSYPLTIPEAASLRYSFRLYDDIDFDCPGRSFTPEAAGAFAGAIRHFPDTADCYFVCDGGCRRSAAIACAALRFWGREKEEFEIWRNPQKEPNALVYTHMCTALGVPIGDDDLDLRIHTNRTAVQRAMRGSK